jgi:hypothetical protein
MILSAYTDYFPKEHQLIGACKVFLCEEEPQF